MNYFVTGATGFIGKFLLERLLAREDAKVHVLVRESSREKFEQMTARLRGLDRETLIVLGGRDSLVRDARPYVSALQAGGARLDVREVSNGGHAVNEERPEHVAGIVIQFLART